MDATRGSVKQNREKKLLLQSSAGSILFECLMARHDQLTSPHVWSSRGARARIVSFARVELPVGRGAMDGCLYPVRLYLFGL